MADGFYNTDWGNQDSQSSNSYGNYNQSSYNQGYTNMGYDGGQFTPQQSYSGHNMDSGKTSITNSSEENKTFF